MTLYFLQVTICWTILYFLYYLLFKNVSFFKVNRFYLLGSVLGGVLFPLLKFVQFQGQPLIVEAELLNFTLESVPVFLFQNLENSNWLPFSFLFSILYFLGMFFFLVRLGVGLYKIRIHYREGRKTDCGDYVLVETPGLVLPFSFLKYIFINKSILTDNSVDSCLKHELVHVVEKHSLDIIIIEIVKSIFWFNPLIYMLNSSICRNHEYQADKVVVEDTDVSIYSRLLLKQSMRGIQMAFSNHIFHSNIKMRITMMYQKKSHQSSWLIYIVIFPVVTMLILTFSCQTNDSDQDSIVPQGIEQRDMDLSEDGKEIFKVVEQMPLFGNASNKAESERNLLRYLASSLKYPAEAREKKIEGTVYIQFVVATDGMVSSAKVIRDIGGGCGQAGLNVINEINNLDVRWTPGVQRGKTVAVLYTVPLRFKLR